MESDKVFAGPVPRLYERHLGPILFQPFADAVAERVGENDRMILETAAGTGIVTRAVAAAAPQSAIVATDLNQAMLDVAAERTSAGGVQWQQADAQALPFAAGSFDLVVCGFGVMFMPDKQAALGEARRVLRPGGRFIFTVWDRIEANPLMHIAEETVARLFPQDPPRFLSRTPCGYHDRTRIERDLREASFTSVAIEDLRRDSEVASASQPAIGLCQGSPLRGEIEARDPDGLASATGAVAAALEERFGRGPFRASLQALLVAAA
ncbi:MAG TPA: methyltransferase domain-containing protein [Microvirga sp.]|nr:methyltransferase domain-containing protein [Microvirga sp.]